MDSIHKAMQKALWDIDISSVPGEAFFQEYKAGANHVLTQIEDILTHPRRYVNSDTSEEEAMLSDIAKLIEQLKEQ